ncbi:Hypothetical predicted protein [Podarcis lilfordi]|nr:Hypothetical predicted protein [Podarcis lilfordi]
MMEGKRRESAEGEGEVAGWLARFSHHGLKECPPPARDGCVRAASSPSETATKMKIGPGQIDVSTEIKYYQSESLTVPMESHITFSRISRIDNGLVKTFNSEILSPKNDLINKPVEEEFYSGQDTYLSSMAEAALNRGKHTLNRENEHAMFEVKMQPCTQEFCDEVLGKYQKLPEATLSEVTTCTYLPQLQLCSQNIHFPSSLMAEHRGSMLSLGTSTADGAVNTNVEMIPVLKTITSTADAKNCDQIKGMINSSTMSQAIPECSGESCNGITVSSQDTAAVCDEITEVREAVVSITANNSDEAVFQNSNGEEISHNLAASQNAMEEPTCSQRNYASPQVIICQLKGGTHILCINNTDTRELKAVHLVPQYQDQPKYPQTDASNSVTSVLGQLLPVGGKLNVCAQELDNGSIYTCHSDKNLQEPTKLTLVGLPCSSWDTKSKKPCNCTKSQCLKLYCDCFANGDFCSNCNCNNCYNNPQHELERIKAIKACLDRNPEAFLPKIGKGKLGDIKPRHNKGCNCKRSGCLKNYCECFEAKIMCSSICKCVGCKNYEESPDRKTLMNIPNYMEIKSYEGNDSVSFSNFEILSKSRKDR